MKKEKKIKKVWFLKPTIRLIEKNSKIENLNKSQFIEKCVLSYLNKQNKKHSPKKIVFNKGEIEILEIMYNNPNAPFYISSIEDLVENNKYSFSRRSVRDIIKKFFKLRLLEKVEGKKNNKYKCFNLTKKGKKVFENYE